MAGGSGERFWPVSTPERPKQLLKLTGSGQTMLEDAIARVEPVVGRENIYISTIGRLVRPIRAQNILGEERILAEPAKRNTAGALTWVAACLAAAYPDEDLSIAVVTSDQRIETNEGFAQTISIAMDSAETTDSLVTIGISPSRPETGYGYIEVDSSQGDWSVKPILRFREKPDADTARQYLAQGNYLWNSGMFFWKLSAFREGLATASPVHAEALANITRALKQNSHEEANAAFELLPNISIDYALMEKAQNALVVKALFEWDDMGAWDSLARSMPVNGDGNVVMGTLTALDLYDSIVYNESDEVEIYAMGLRNIVIVVSNNKVMICPREKAQEVRALAQKSNLPGS